MNEFEPFARQGWQCPICKRVYSPDTQWCYFCGGKSTNTVTSGTYRVGVDVLYGEEKEQEGDK